MRGARPTIPSTEPMGPGTGRVLGLPTPELTDDRAIGSAVTSGTAVDSDLALAARPLLELVRLLTGMETTFVTRIDWSDQMQEVVVADNSTAELVVPEGSLVPWRDSMCRLVFLAGTEQSANVPADFADSIGARVLGMQSFFALPVLAGADTVIGTVCGASRHGATLDDEQIRRLRLIAAALANLMRVNISLRGARARADAAQLESQDARAQAAEATRTAQSMTALAMTDPLTGLANRRAFTARWEQELARSGRHGSSIALLMLDLDGLKTINDTQGHAVGDQVLAAVGGILRSIARAEDVVARIGGDEFVLMAPHTDAAGAENIGERIARALALRAVDLPAPCTVTTGISASASTPRHELFEAADRALYDAKRAGRDRMVVWTGPLAAGSPGRPGGESASGPTTDVPG